MNRIKLFTHTDLDGIGCAIVAYHAFGRENVDVEYCDYNNVNERITAFLDGGYTDRYTLVYITDISVNDAVADRLDAFGNARLFDHHATSEWLNRYNWAFVQTRHTEGYLRSGTEMFFTEVCGFIDKFVKLDEFSESVRRYDTWEWKNVYNDTHAKELNDLLYIVGRDRFVDRFTADPFVKFTDTERMLLDLEAERIEAYKRGKEREVIVRMVDGYDIGVVFAERYNSELGNHLAESRPDLACIAIINPAKSVSYRGIDRMNCGLFAKERGGGGHKNAAGSPITDEMRSALIDVIFGEVIE